MNKSRQTAVFSEPRKVERDLYLSQLCTVVTVGVAERSNDRR